MTLLDSTKTVVATGTDNIDLSPIPVGIYYVEIDFSGPATTYNLGYDGQAIFLQMPVPEPASLALLGIGLAGAGLLRRRRRR